MAGSVSLIPPEDLQVECWPPRHKGGQQVTLTSTGVKVTHIPSGIEVCVYVARSQHDNRLIALNMIEAAITHPRFR